MIRQFPALLRFGVGTLLAQNPANPAPEARSWKPLQFLIGSWEAKTQGGSAGAAASGTYTFQLELRGHVLARHSASAGCNGPSGFDCEHGDLLYVYQDSSDKAF